MAGIRLIVQMQIAEGSTEAFIDAWTDHLAEVLDESGCLQYEMFRSVTNPQRIAMVEHWADREAFETHWSRELAREGGPGAGAAAAMVVESDGALYHTEVYDHAPTEFTGTEWVALEG